ncbi:Aste57867_10357 [Aphanomyces stellatus]|uniref:Aste57867_10357 protein n=1 Tax=Aphanomyces stellatus TaxID=120398 RepID=A0A485KQT4_9STRA|nr:hypothetical protein As57867_010317 [Aphanomyces stellatus]VFT87231.1 Aste57867_10357 [Aphanomyces stellatus]
MPMTRRGRVRKFDHVDRMLLLQEAGGFTQKEVACMCFDAIAIRRSREETFAEDGRRGEGQGLGHPKPSHGQASQDRVQDWTIVGRIESIYESHMVNWKSFVDFILIAIQ